MAQQPIHLPVLEVARAAKAAFFDPHAALLAKLAEIDASGPRTAHWTPRDYEGLADSISAASEHKARFGGEAA